MYIGKGHRINRYIHLPRKLREDMLKPVIDEARRHGMEYALCREEELHGRE